MVTIPPGKDNRMAAPKTGLQLTDLKDAISLAKELARDAEKTVQAHRSIAAQNRKMVRRARQARAEAQARRVSISRKRMASSDQ